MAYAAQSGRGRKVGCRHPDRRALSHLRPQSTDEGLDREFNTLQAQREAAESYIGFGSPSVTQFETTPNWLTPSEPFSEKANFNVTRSRWRGQPSSLDPIARGLENAAERAIEGSIRVRKSPCFSRHDFGGALQWRSTPTSPRLEFKRWVRMTLPGGVERPCPKASGVLRVPDLRSSDIDQAALVLL